MKFVKKKKKMFNLATKTKDKQNFFGIILFSIPLAFSFMSQ